MMKCTIWLGALVALVAAPSADAQWLAGSWKVSTGKAMSGKRYTGTAQFTARGGGAMNVKWTLSDGKYKGIALATGSHAAAMWTGKKGGGGVAIYQISADKSTMKGSWTELDGRVGSESGRLTVRGKGFRWTLNGRAANGSTYRATLDVYPMWSENEYPDAAQTYNVVRKQGGKTQKGVAIEQGRKLFVTWGSKGGGVVAFEKSRKGANGHYAMRGKKGWGTQHIARQH